MILARLLNPRDFGLVGMVTAFTGVLNLFRDFGLSAASVQRSTVTEEQISALFWINLLVGLMLAFFLAGMAPIVAAFYHEPHLLPVTMVLAIAYVFNAAGIQHSALLQRQMRFTALATIDIIALVLSASTGIVMAAAGLGYWSLVGSAVSLPLVATCCLWLTTGWRPERPSTRVELRSLMRFGGGLTLTSLLGYLAFNCEKVLLGRFWGAEAVGIYGRSYQLINIPTDSLNSAAGEVAFAALSRIRDDPNRFRSYFLKGYSLVLALTIPITIAVALLAPDLIFVLLGAKWRDAADIFRLLSPTILIFAIINPLGWVGFSLGMVRRNVKVALVLTPVMISSYIIGLPYGPKGVALAYSAMMTLWVVPHIAWVLHGTVVSLRDIVQTASRPVLSGLVAAVFVFGVLFFFGQSLSHLPRLVLGGSVLIGVYAGMLFQVMGQKTFYINLLRGMTTRSSVEESALVTP